MVRKRRIEFSGAIYHVWTRGNNRQQIFIDDDDRWDLLNSLAEAVSKDGIVLYAFCLMDNHFHMLVETTGTPLNRVMRALLTKYSRTFNKRHSRVGHLFQGRYQASLCEKENYWLELVRYIHLNPVRAGLVDAPEDWRWSSHREYLGRSVFPMVTSAPVLEEFGQILSSARTAYRHFIKDGMEDIASVQRPWGDRKQDGTLIGSGSFHKRVRNAVAKPRRRKIDLPAGRRRIEDIIQSISERENINPREVCGKCRRMDVARVRREIFLIATEAGWSQAEVARSLKRTESWASHLRRRHPESELGV